MKSFLIKRKTAIICTVASVILMALVWVIAYYCVGNDYIVPSFSQTMVTFFKLFAEAEFWIAFLNTFLRTLIAAAVSFVLGAVTASLSVLSKTFAALIKPVMVLLRTVPTLAVILILLIWTNPKVAPIVVTVLVLFPMVNSQITAAVGGIDRGIIEMAQTYGVSKRDRLFKIYLPLTAPNILAQTGANISLGIKIMISAEVLSNTFKSLGGLMQNARLYLEMPKLAALTLVAVFLGLIIDVVFTQTERITKRWNK